MPPVELPPLAEAQPTPLTLETPALSLSALPPLGLPAPRLLASRGTGRRAVESERSAPSESQEEAVPDGPMESDQVDEPPRERSGNARPQYPRLAQRRQISGSVRVRMLIGTDGHVRRWEVLRTEGHRSFETAVEEVLPRLRFSPGSHRGRTVEVWVRKTFEFQWEGRS